MRDQQFILEGPPHEISPPTVQLGQCLVKRLRNYKNKVAQIFPESKKKVTFKEIVDRSLSVAIELRARGVGKGDVVVTFCENCPEFTYILIGTLLVGATLAPVNNQLDVDDQKSMLDMLKPCMVFTIAKLEFIVRRLTGSKTKIVVLGDDSIAWNKFLMHKNKDFVAENINVDKHPAVIICSSGTMGSPKGIQLSHSNLYYMMTQLRRNDNAIASDQVAMTVSPMFWISGLFGILMSLDSGFLSVIVNVFEAEYALSIIEKFKVNLLTLGPSQVAAIAKCSRAEKYDASSLIFLGYGGAPLSKAMQELAERKLKRKVVSVYGLTEFMFAIAPGPLIIQKPASSGELSRGVKAKVVDLETGAALGPNQEGELCFKGPTLMLGYLNNDQATATTIDNEGWLHTGDIGYYDEDHYFYIYDRIKELIKYKGFSVAPSEIEDVLLSHPDVKEAAVISIHHDLDQERAMAFVVRQPGATVTEEDLLTLVSNELSEMKWLHGGLQFIDALPRTASGKIKRRELRAGVQTTS